MGYPWRAWNGSSNRLENGEIVLNNKTGELIRKPVAMKDAAKVATDFMTRQQVLRKDETEKPQVSQQSVTDQLAALAMEFAKWQKVSSAKTEAIDIESKEIPNEDLQEMQGTETPDGIQQKNNEGKNGPTAQM